MKRGTPDHPKTKRFARALGVPSYAAMGLLEVMVNHWAPDFAVTGAIGKWNDQDIADGLGWDGDAATLVAALVDSGYVDRHPEHRLVIHDWELHADQGVRNKLKKLGLAFVTAVVAPASDLAEATPDPGPTQVEPKSDPGPSRLQATGNGSTESAARDTARARGPAPAWQIGAPIGDAASGLLDAAFVATVRAEFPGLCENNFRGAAVALVWKRRAGGTLVPRFLEPLDGVRTDEVSTVRLCLAVDKYLKAKVPEGPEAYSVSAFVAKLGHWLTRERKPAVSVAVAIPDTKPERTDGERARVAELADPRNWAKKARA